MSNTHTVWFKDLVRVVVVHISEFPSVLLAKLSRGSLEMHLAVSVTKYEP